MLPHDWALPNPADWIAVLQHAVPQALADSGIDRADVIAVGTDFTSCTVRPTDRDGLPLCELSARRDHPHAWPKLWCHRAAQSHADRIAAAAACDQDVPWRRRYGGKQSSEWPLPKALQVLEEDPDVYDVTERWTEARTARIRARSFLPRCIPTSPTFAVTRLEHPLPALGTPAGGLTDRAAGWTGLPPGVVVAVGNIDAHVSAPAAQVTEAGQPCW